MAKLGTLLPLLLAVPPRICQVYVLGLQSSMGGRHRSLRELKTLADKQDKIGMTCVLAVLIEQHRPYLHPLEILPPPFISVLSSHETAAV